MPATGGALPSLSLGEDLPPGGSQQAASSSGAPVSAPRSCSAWVPPSDYSTAEVLEPGRCFPTQDPLIGRLCSEGPPLSLVSRTTQLRTLPAGKWVSRNGPFFFPRAGHLSPSTCRLLVFRASCLWARWTQASSLVDPPMNSSPGNTQKNFQRLPQPSKATRDRSWGAEANAACQSPRGSSEVNLPKQAMGA